MATNVISAVKAPPAGLKPAPAAEKGTARAAPSAKPAPTPSVPNTPGSSHARGARTERVLTRRPLRTGAPSAPSAGSGRTPADRCEPTLDCGCDEAREQRTAGSDRVAHTACGFVHRNGGKSAPQADAACQGEHDSRRGIQARVRRLPPNPRTASALQTASRAWSIGANGRIRRELNRRQATTRTIRLQSGSRPAPRRGPRSNGEDGAPRGTAPAGWSRARSSPARSRGPRSPAAGRRAAPPRR